MLSGNWKSIKSSPSLPPIPDRRMQRLRLLNSAGQVNRTIHHVWGVMNVILNLSPIVHGQDCRAAPCSGRAVSVSRCVPTLAFGHSLVTLHLTLHPATFIPTEIKFIQTIFNKWYVIYSISYQSLPASRLLTVYHSASLFLAQFTVAESLPLCSVRPRIATNNKLRWPVDYIKY